jgi:tetratricopeptide (TPR) repeat protein
LSRLTRHEILKEDKFLTTVEATRDFFIEKRKPLLLSIGGAVALLLIILGTRYYMAQQNEAAKDELSRALKIYHSPVGAQATPAPGSDPLYATAKEKHEKALAEFQKVVGAYASRPAGKIARYYAGLCLRDLNKTSEAIAMLEPLSKEKSDYGGLAQRALATVYESSGNLARATEVYQQIVQNDVLVIPKGESLMHLAELYQQQNKPADATKIYRQVVKDFPGTPYMTEAEQKLKTLSQ